MCDFHSVIVTGDGRILHNATNSHSSIANEHNLEKGLDAKWWECEWNGIGDDVPLPNVLVQSRGKTAEPTQAAYNAATRHYDKLRRILLGELDVDDTAPFNTPAYVDVQEKAKLAPAMSMLADMDADDIRKLLDGLGHDCGDLYSDELESEYQSGMEAGGEDMYSWESVQEAIANAKEKWESERDELDDEARDEAYLEGYKAARLGKQSAVEFIDGMPSFLF